MIHLVTGGARSGKSSFVLNLMESATVENPVHFIATAQALDPDMADRIARHKQERGPHYRTIEAPIAVAEAVCELRARREQTLLIVDCLTMWVSNLLFADYTDEAMYAEFDRLAAALAVPEVSAAVVTNEVGWGIVPGDPISRRYRDLLGRCNQRFARDAAQVTLLVAGVPLRIVT